jgi:hypothetical protein
MVCVTLDSRNLREIINGIALNSGYRAIPIPCMVAGDTMPVGQGTCDDRLPLRLFRLSGPLFEVAE